jgi:lipopolysaccharide/colanic/teichoic acid biosynthesis glycosyltransferase
MSRAKRIFDLVTSSLALAALAMPFGLIALAIKLDSPGPIFFCQVRMGQFGRTFRIFKFRTMRNSIIHNEITVGNNDRVTGIGRFLRRTKIDELPQLINILTGDMSFVGPRPELPAYVEKYPYEDKHLILSVPPGLTDFASLRFRRESDILASHPEPIKYYEDVILPMKRRYCRLYIRRATLRLDVYLIALTILNIVQDALAGASRLSPPAASVGTRPISFTVMMARGKRN